MFKIGDFSKLSMVSIRMLRHYNEIGLLVPDQIDSFTGYRYYSAAQLERVNRIQTLHRMGFSLKTIKEILNEYNNPASLQSYLKIHMKQLQEESENLQGKLSLVETAIHRLGEDQEMTNYNIALKTFPETKVMSVRRVIPTYEKEGELWQTLYGETGGMNVAATTTPYNCAAVFYDEGFRETDVDVEVRVPVTGDYKDTEHVRFKTVGAVTAATVTISGSYENISSACEAVGRWISDNQYEMCGPMFNIYHVSPAMDPNPNNWVTEICFPVKKA